MSGHYSGPLKVALRYPAMLVGNTLAGTSVSGHSRPFSTFKSVLLSTHRLHSGAESPNGQNDSRSGHVISKLNRRERLRPDSQGLARLGCMHGACHMKYSDQLVRVIWIIFNEVLSIVSYNNQDYVH